MTREFDDSESGDVQDDEGDTVRGDDDDGDNRKDDDGDNSKSGDDASGDGSSDIGNATSLTPIYKSIYGFETLNPIGGSSLFAL